MHIDAFNEMHRRGRIEPETSAAQSDEEVGLISIAISLKRIADALWGNETHDGGTTGIVQLLNGIEMNGRQH